MAESTISLHDIDPERLRTVIELVRTRAYNLKTEKWAVITPEGHKPGERCLHECFTSASGALVLYGGQDDGNFALGDLWAMGKERDWERLDDPQAKWRRLYGVTEAGAEGGEIWSDYYAVPKGAPHREAGYVETKTPIILQRTLWEKSGHWENYRENMYTTEVDEQALVLGGGPSLGVGQDLAGALWENQLQALEQWRRRIQGKR